MKLRGYLFLAVPVAVALAQLTLTFCCDLTSWRGGGFGMYSAPHPKTGRQVWLVGRGRDGAERAVRLSPLDYRLRVRATPASRRYGARLERMQRIAYRGKNFPVQLDDALIASSLRELLARYGDDEVVAALFPVSDLEVRVVEVFITSDYEAVDSRTLVARKLRPESES